MLCAKGAQILQSKSINVEDAANELISMLCDVGESEEGGDDEEKDDTEGLSILTNPRYQILQGESVCNCGKAETKAQ